MRMATRSSSSDPGATVIATDLTALRIGDADAVSIRAFTMLIFLWAGSPVTSAVAIGPAKRECALSNSRRLQRAQRWSGLLPIAALPACATNRQKRNWSAHAFMSASLPDSGRRPEPSRCRLSANSGSAVLAQKCVRLVNWTTDDGRAYRASGTAATCHRAFRLADLVGARRSRAIGADTKERTARDG
jgi:hypothetical protein